MQGEKCWCCGEVPVSWDKDNLGHCGSCKHTIYLTQRNGHANRTCSCKGPPDLCHECRKPIVWDEEWEKDGDGDDTKHGKCTCSHKTWGWAEYTNPRETYLFCYSKGLLG